MKDRIFSIVAESIGKNIENVSMDTSIYDGTDSLDRLGMVFDVEEAFDISIDNVEANKIRTISDIVTLVEKKMKVSNQSMSDLKAAGVVENGLDILKRKIEKDSGRFCGFAGQRSEV